MLKKAVKKRWVEALRSGEYKQTQERLLDDQGRMCCLGVLCDLEAKGDWVRSADGHWTFDPDSKKFTPSDAGGLPMWLLDKVGLTIENEATLIDLNDGEGFDFNGIASYIEANL